MSAVDTLPAGPPCPQCNSADTVCLEGASRHSWADYHRCSGCGYVWAIKRAIGLPPCDPDNQSAP